jgi:hypothetical protein
MPITQGSHPFKLFLCTVISEDSVNLAVLSPIAWSSFSQKVITSSRKSDLSRGEGGSNTSNSSEVSANVTFLAKIKQQRGFIKNGS